MKNVAINKVVYDFLNHHQSELSNLKKANHWFEEITGIINFIAHESDLQALNEKLIPQKNTLTQNEDRREYADFQTNERLTQQIIDELYENNFQTEFILEPTCGKGHFLVSSLRKFRHFKKIVGIEIYKPYVWQTKLNILTHYIQNPHQSKPKIQIIHANIFDFDLKSLAQQTASLQTFIIGNPPWITNSDLSKINSKNLPHKSNFKKYQGLDAMTGKSNFDIGEYISLLLLQYFQYHQGHFAFLVKNTVVKNILYVQRKNQYTLAQFEKRKIDAKKEFDVAVHASLFTTKLNQNPTFTCLESDFYNKITHTKFGWSHHQFVQSIDNYEDARFVEGKSPFVWRSGIKHDCAKVMELEKLNGHYINAQKQAIDLEQDLVYGLLKSSDLKFLEAQKPRKVTVVTQKSIGQDTAYIALYYPLTFEYLTKNKAYFEQRKSSIYRDKPPFSIFGVGDYSFAPYKIAISGLYKTTHFTLVLPDNEKPVMLDDTCYFIGFQELNQAKIAHHLLNSDAVQNFLKAITFLDTKRPMNKDILMRIDLKKVYQQTDYNRLIKPQFELEDWLRFEALFSDTKTKTQLSLF